MQLRYVLLLALAAVVTAESDYSQSAYSYAQESPSQYYGHRRRQQSGLAGLVRGLFSTDDNRRQFTGLGNILPAAPVGGIGGLLGPALTVGLLVAIGVGLLALALASLDFNSSGRGLDTDEWEVDHSLWMNQLQKDFEDSWSTE